MIDRRLERDEALAIVRRFLIEGMGANDFDLVAEMLTEDCVVRMPNSPGGASDTVGREVFREEFKRVVPGFLKRISFTIDSEAFDPMTQRVVLEYHSEGERADGRAYGNTYVGTWDLRGEQVSKWQEYFNPLLLA